MKKPIFIVALLECAVLHAMSLGLRTAVWSVAAANGRAVRTEVERLLPADCEESQLPEVLEAFDDLMLVAHITNKTEYTEFRDWALGLGENADALTSSQMAWRSFAMALATLASAPEEGDLHIEEVSPSDVSGAVEIVFSLEDVQVGRSALEARLKTIFDVEGSTSLEADSFSADGLRISLTPTDDGRIKATITPPADAVDSFFMRVKMK